MTEHQVIRREIEHQRIRRNHCRPVRRVQMIFADGEAPLPDDGMPPVFGWALPLRAPLADFVRGRT